ncbi:hypothetical protein, partial [Klebsiella pneumoniae]|uniref:hypothetical protein n=1 Tax=Klebsiella pneumoniae TaxID=573 RepID=UPI002731758D
MSKTALAVIIRSTIGGEQSTESHKENEKKTRAANAVSIQDNTTQNRHQEESIGDGIEGDKQAIIGVAII